MTRRLCGTLALAALASFLLAPTQQPSQAEVWKQSLAQVDEALETNPSEVSEASVNSCRSMRKTAVLLYKMGHHARAFRRLASCRALLRIDWVRNGQVRPVRDTCLA
jgi:hypothetical protein